MREPIASLSLDLDNKWSYLRTLGPGHWEDYPCYLDLVTPRIIETMRRFDLGMTVFAVGKDLETRSGQESIGSLAEAGCEIGNHSYNHYPWLHTLSRAEQRREITDTHQAIQRVTAVAPRGFRGPGFSTSETLLDLLTELDYVYDSSSLPAVTAPLARLYCAANSLWTSGPRGQMFGAWTDAFRPLRPHRVDTPHGPLTELPVTTMPLLRTPIHMTYLMHLSQYSPAAARGYLRAALRLCRLRGVGPSMLLHPLDFLGGDECPELAWFPGMRLARGAKQEQLCRLMDLLGRSFQITSLATHAGVPAVTEPGRVEVMPLEAVAVEAAAE